MGLGTLYGIGIGPGDPDLITLKGARIIASSRHVMVPKARKSSESLALNIIKRHINPKAEIHEVVFPMTEERDVLNMRWRETAAYAASLLSRGEDICFPTLGDPMLYSTYIYLVRSLREILPGVGIITVPGVNAFSAAAALAGVPVGEGKQAVTIIPGADDMDELREALSRPGTVVIMKIGKRLDPVLDLLEECHALGSGVFAAYVGMDGEHVETDLKRLRDRDEKTGYMSIIMTKTGGKGNK